MELIVKAKNRKNENVGKYTTVQSEDGERLPLDQEVILTSPRKDNQQKFLYL
jgi:hypothetical protein